MCNVINLFTSNPLLGSVIALHMIITIRIQDDDPMRRIRRRMAMMMGMIRKTKFIIVVCGDNNNATSIKYC